MGLEENFYIKADAEKPLEDYGNALASYNYPYQDGSTYGRPGFTRWGYEEQRCAERLPVKHKEIMVESERVYEQVGLVRNIIDLITDFTVSGIRVVHSQPSVEKFYQNWFSRVCGIDRSERFTSNLYKFGNVIVRRRWATLTKKGKKDIRRAKASEDTVDLLSVKAPSRRIPSRYIFLNPSTVEVIGGDLARFVGPRVLTYGVRIPMSFRKRFDEKSPADQNILKEIPEEIKQAADSSNEQFIPLKPDDTLVFHYKKEDWQVWSKPIIYGVLSDIYTLEKLKLADLTALDGATERVRIFKLGDLKEHIYPDVGAFSKMNELLRVNAGAGTRNLVWGPDIELIESNVESYKFLGQEKYEPILSAIFAGLGIPPTLTGTSSGASGTTNNLISLKSLIKRLEYGRQKLIEFWQIEFELVRQTMGFQKAAVLEFDQNNLGDEEAEKRLFIELADRDIIPFEVVQRKFGLDPTVNSDKVETEWDQRDKDQRQPKASPFHNAQFDQQLKKSLLDRGQITPSEIELELAPRKKGDKTNLMPAPIPGGGTPSAKKTNKAPNGRPPQKTDSQPRKSRRFAPVVKSQLWAQAAQSQIADLLNPIILNKYNRKNMRSLTAEETESAEKLKFAAFFNLELGEEVNANKIPALLKSFPVEGYNQYTSVAIEVAENLGRELTFAELHSIQIGVYLNGKDSG